MNTTTSQKGKKVKKAGRTCRELQGDFPEGCIAVMHSCNPVLIGQEMQDNRFTLYSIVIEYN